MMQVLHFRLLQKIKSRGKRLIQAVAVTPVAAWPQSRLFIFDNTNSLHFLVDTGEEISIIPPSPKQLDLKPFPVILDSGLIRQYPFVLTIAQVHRFILHINFSHRFDIIVDIRSPKLIGRMTTLKPPQSTQIRLAMPPLEEFSELLSQFSNILSSSCNANATNNVRHGLEPLWEEQMYFSWKNSENKHRKGDVPKR